MSVTHSTFNLQRTYDASPGRVFAAFADPEQKAAWPLLRRVAVVDGERVAVRVLEERLVADARVDRRRPWNSHAARFELGLGGLEVVDPELDRVLWGLNSSPNASDCMTAIVRLPVSNSPAGIFPQRLPSSRPSTSR